MRDGHLKFLSIVFNELYPRERVRRVSRMRSKRTFNAFHAVREAHGILFGLPIGILIQAKEAELFKTDCALTSVMQAVICGP